MSDRAASTAVTYIGLPISSGGAHSLGRLTRRQAFDRAMSFLRICTEPTGPVNFWFDAHEVPVLGRVTHLEQRMRRQFGGDQAAPTPFPKMHGVSASRVPEALDFLDEIAPQPTNQWGMAPIWFWAFSKFRILDPLTGNVLPGQDPERFGGVEYEARVPLGTSNLRLILNNRAALGLELCIPDATDEVMSRVVPWLQEHLPCKLSPNHWRAWIPTKSGSLMSRRMPAPRDIPAR